MSNRSAVRSEERPQASEWCGPYFQMVHSRSGGPRFPNCSSSVDGGRAVVSSLLPIALKIFEVGPTPGHACPINSVGIGRVTGARGQNSRDGRMRKYFEVCMRLTLRGPPWHGRSNLPWGYKDLRFPWDSIARPWRMVFQPSRGEEGREREAILCVCTYSEREERGRGRER